MGSRVGSKLFCSDLIDSKWKKGFAPVGMVEWDSIGYVARYSLKKRYGAAGDVFYGERPREFATMSRRPGVGRSYFEKYYQEMYPRDEVMVNGKLRRPPVRYDHWLKGVDYDLFEKVQAKRLAEQRPDPTPHELGMIELNMKEAQKRWTANRKKV